MAAISSPTQQQALAQLRNDARVIRGAPRTPAGCSADGFPLGDARLPAHLAKAHETIAALRDENLRLREFKARLQKALQEVAP